MPDGCGGKMLLSISSIPCHTVEMREGRGRLSGGREGQHNIFNLTQRHEAPPPQNLLLEHTHAGRLLCADIAFFVALANYYIILHL